MNTAIRFEMLTALPDSLATLCELSEADGFRFLRRLIDDWHLGHNRFNLHGEILLGALIGDRLVAIGGINCDCDDDGLARLRRVYVHPDFRKDGVGRELVARLETHARAHFRRITLFTDRADAAQFYEGLGYRPVIGHPQRSHQKLL